MALSYLDNGIIRIGCFDAGAGPGVESFLHGGSIGWFGLSASDNWVNNTDWGRQIQQSYYGATPDPLEPTKQWGNTPWPWNPTQSLGQLVAFTNDGLTIYSRTKPFDWASSGVIHEDIVMEQWTTLQGNVAVIRCKTSLLGPDAHGFHGGEVPACFFNNYLDLYFYDGAAPWTDDALTMLQPDPPGGGLTPSSCLATETWWAYIDPGAGIGVGIYTPVLPIDVPTNAVFYRTDGTSYVSPVLDTGPASPGGILDYTYYLTIGTLAEIRARFAALHAAEATGGPGWCQRAWSIRGVRVGGEKGNKALRVKMPGGILTADIVEVDDTTPVRIKTSLGIKGVR